MKHPQITKIYKYRDFTSRSLNMLANNELYFANSGSFNDIFDCRARKEFEFKDDEDFVNKWTPLEASHQNISIQNARSFVEHIVKNDHSKEKYIREKSEMFQKLVLQSFGICSFSEISNDILMWSHYSDSHKGFCIEFNRSPENMLAHANPIDYPEDDEFPYINYWLGPKNEAQLDEVKIIITTKSKHWKYEKEWRIVNRPQFIDEHYRGHTVEYSDEMISGIIFGSRMDSKARTTIKNIMAGKPVTFYEAKPVKNKFCLEIIPTQ